MSTSNAPPEDASRPEGASEQLLLDRFLKALMPHFRAELATWLVGERPVVVETIGTVLAAVEERAVDEVLWLRFDTRPDLLLHVEFQLEGRADLPERMAQYIALLVRTEAYKEKRAPLACVVVYLDEAVYRHDPGLFEVQGKMGTRLLAEYRVVRLWEEDPKTILALEEPGLCLFGPLLRGDKKALCVQSGQRIQGSKLPEGLKRDLLGVLSGLVARTIKDRKFVRRFLLEIEAMGENYVFQLLREEGALREARRILLRMLARRFGPVPEDLRALVESVSALERLETLHDEAVGCPSVEAFRGLIAAG